MYKRGTFLKYFGKTILLMAMAVIALLLGIASWYFLPVSRELKILIMILWGIVVLFILGAEFSRHKRKTRVLYLGVLLLFAGWWVTIKPSNDRLWEQDVAHTVTGTVNGNHVTLHSVRNFIWRGVEEYDPAWEDRQYDIEKLSSVDLFLSSWGSPAIAHTLISFGFTDGQYVTFSVEIRKELGEKFSEIAGFFKQYEIALIAADERDIIKTRTHIRKEDVLRYRVNLTPEQRERLFLSYVERGNELAKEPSFYNTITANCTTVVFDMVRLIVPSIPMDYRVLVSGYLPSYIYDLGAFEQGKTLEELTRQGQITALADIIGEDPAYSALIRDNTILRDAHE